MPRFTSRTLAAVAFALVVWASAFAGIRAGLRAYSPANLAILRFLVASLVLAIYAGIAHFRRPELRDIPGLVLTGAIGITFYNLALNYGEMRVTAGAASLLIASTPIWTALAARLWLHEKLTAFGWLGVFVSFVGVALIASGEGEGIRLSLQALIILAAAVTSALYMIMQKHYLGRYSALEFTAYSIWFGTALMIPLRSRTDTEPAHRARFDDTADNLSWRLSGSPSLCRMGLRAFTRCCRTHGDAALRDSDCRHRHCVDLARRGSKANFSCRRSDRAWRRGAGEYGREKEARQSESDRSDCLACVGSGGLSRRELYRARGDHDHITCAASRIG